MYLEWRKHDAAAAELEKAIALSPQDSTLRIRLGEAYLNLGDHDRAMATFDRAVALAPDPRTWNEIAYQLALNKTDLELARRYAESAVAARSLASRNISLDRVTALDLWHMSELAADWDTLGWVHLAQGDFKRAEKFVRAAWLLLQNAEVGDHLGQIYEKQGRRDDAVRMYALALNAERPDEKTRDRLAALVGGADRVEAALHEQHDALARGRTIVLDQPGAAGASADFFVVFARGPVETVKFIGGDERLRPLVDALAKAKFDVVFPDDDSVKIVRRGTLSCAPAGGSAACRFVMMLPYDAQLAQQN
jgi:tetratricopeptide (TPR) repeat protein